MVLVSLLLAVVSQPPAGTGPMEVAGRVVGAEGRPVAGAEVLVSGLLEDGFRRPVQARTTSDPQGRFRLTVPALKDASFANLPITVWAIRPGQGLGGLMFPRQKPPKEDALLIKLGAAGGTDVRVLGPDGTPVAGAKVVPLQYRVDQIPGGATRRIEIPGFPVPDDLADRLAATTGPNGCGRLAEVAPGTVQFEHIEAPGYGRQLVSGAAVVDGRLTLTLAAVGRLAGRLVADDPKVVRGLTVSVLSRPESEVKAGAMGQARVVTDADGRFEVAALPVGQLILNVQVPEGSGLSVRPPRDQTIVAGKVTEVTIPVKMPAKTRSIAGRVVDSRGQPVAGATIFQTGDATTRTSAETDAQGRFTLPGVSVGPTFIFGRAKGFRFAGQALKAGPESSEPTLTLIREGETPAARMATLPPIMTADQELAVAKRVLEPYATQVVAKGEQNDKIQVLEVLARVDPARVLALVEGPTLTEPFLKTMFRLRVAGALLETAQDEAVAVAESIEDPGARAMGLVQAADALPETERARKLELLDRALVGARAAREPTGIRLILMAQVAEHWLDMGLTDKGTRLIREAQPDAEQLPTAAWPGYARGAFAEELSQVDLDAALKLVKGLSDPREFDRHHGNIAHELAGRDPAAAERVLGMIKDSFQRDQYAPRVVYRMARLDLPRARRLAVAMKDAGLRGYGLGMAALGLAEAKKSADATALLAEALDTLEKAAGASDPLARGLFGAIPTASALLPVAERIDPALVPETFWRVLSLRQPRPVDVRNYDAGLSADLSLALMLARYDRDVARTLLAPNVGPQAPSWVGDADRGLAFVAAAVIDPSWGVALVEALPVDPDLKFQSTRNRARCAVAAALTRHGEARWRYLLYRYLNLSPPDLEDIAANL